MKRIISRLLVPLIWGGLHLVTAQRSQGATPSEDRSKSQIDHVGFAELSPIPVWQEYQRRVQCVRQTPGLAAFWDFVQREDGPNGSGNFLALTAQGDEHRYLLEPHNVSLDYWRDGAKATLADFPLLGRGPFGQAIQFHAPKAQNDLPVLEVPRAVLQDTPLDVKGPGKSVSMIVWLIYQDGEHAVAGIWHEGTDSPPKDIPAVIRERGQRQFGMFAGLTAHPGAVGAHVSENGLASFGGIYAGHMAVTPEKMHPTKLDATPGELDASWSVAGFVYDNEQKTVTAYLNGVATDCWIENPGTRPFYKNVERAWRQAKLAKIPSLQAGADTNFPPDQFYEPPENNPISVVVESESPQTRTELRTYQFTKVRTILHKNNQGAFTEVVTTDLVALKANPYWFGHDIYAPRTPSEGGPFTIGRVIHSNRHPTLSAYFGGVAVYDRALSADEMQKLSRIGRNEKKTTDIKILTLADILKPSQ